jgi:hypothetical protein
MASAHKSTHKGWEITIRCLKIRTLATAHGHGDKFTASGRAVLRDVAHDEEWTDARAQVLTLRGQAFRTEAACTDALLTAMTVLLDALWREAPQHGRTSSHCNDNYSHL